MHTAYPEAGAKRLQIGFPSLPGAVATPPSWVPRYVDLIEKLRANAAIARHMLQTIELTVFEAMVGGKAHETPAFDRLFTPSTATCSTSPIGVSATSQSRPSPIR